MGLDKQKNRQIVNDNLHQISDIDPLYRPARFFLAYHSLLEGDVEQALRIFKSITDAVNKDAESILGEVKVEWIKRKSHLYKLYPRFLKNFLLPWAHLWQDIQVSITGSLLYTEAHHWKDFNKLFEDSKKSDQIGYEEAFFQSHINIYTNKYGIKKYVKIAAGILKDNVTPEEAYKVLDSILDTNLLRDLQFELESLERNILLISTYTRIENLKLSSDEHSIIITNKSLQKIKDLQIKNHIVRIIYLNQFKNLQKFWEQKEWDKCKSIIRTIGIEICSPDTFKSGRLLEQALNLPKKTGWIIRLLMPSYKLLDKYERTYQNSLFIESLYYQALSEYQMFKIFDCNLAMKHANELFTRHLDDLVTTNKDNLHYMELKALAHCLAIDAATRILQLIIRKDEDSDIAIKINAEMHLEETIETYKNSKVRDNTKDISENLRYSSNVRAAAYNTRGLSARYNRIKELGRRKENRDYESDVTNIQTELRYFFESLNIKRMPDTCFYIAESLIDSKREQEAELYIKEALRMCPNHRGIKLLNIN